MTKEKNIQRSIRKYLKSLPDCWNCKGDTRDRRGIPDIIVCFCGLFIAFEVKRTDKDEATKIQKYEIGMIKRANGLAFVVSSVDEVKAVLDGVCRNDSLTDMITRIIGRNVQPSDVGKL